MSKAAAERAERHRLRLTAKRTGPDPELLQDDCRALFSWFAAKPDARCLVRESCKQIEELRCRNQN